MLTRAMLALALSLASAQAALITSSPIPVSGFASGASDGPGVQAKTIFISGTNGVDAVNVNVNSGCFGVVFSGGIFGLSCNGFPGASVAFNGTIYTRFTMDLFGGTGTLNTYDPTDGTLLATTALEGYANVRPCSFPFCGPQFITIDILATPEPSTWLLCGAGLVGLLATRFRRRS